MRTLCDACESAAAIVFCAADEAALCRACDEKVHMCNKLASRHVRVGLASPSDVPRCDICENAPAFFYCETDGSSLCLQCDMIVHVGGKRTHGRYLLFRQRVEFPGDKPGLAENPTSQPLDQGETKRGQNSLPKMKTGEKQQNHRMPLSLTPEPDADGHAMMETKMIDLNMKPQRIHEHTSNNQRKPMKTKTMRQKEWLITTASWLFLFLSFPALSYGVAPPHTLLNKLSQGKYVNNEELWFNQTLDHFSPYDRRQFRQRYYEFLDYFRIPDGPIFLVICGEGPCNGIVNDYIIVLAKKFGAAVVSLEHRYYGKSSPFDSLTTENLKYLSSKQALFDLAVFRQYYQDSLNAKLNRTKIENPWFFFGGSYSGALSAWFRLKFPHLTCGSLASSAVVLSVYNFTEFDRQVGESAGAECKAVLQEITQLVEHRLATNGRALKASFNAVDLENDVDFLYLLADAAAVAFQYGNPDKVCKPLVEAKKAGEDLVDTYATYVKEYYLGTFGAQAHSYDQQYLKITSNIEDSSTRLWWFQVCTEVAYFQVAPSNDTIRSSKIDTRYHLDLCKNLFGEGIFPDVDTTNLYYGGTKIAGSKIIFTNGSQDPWRHASKQISSPDLPSYTITCYNCGHVTDMRGCPQSPLVIEGSEKNCTSPDAVHKVRQKIAEHMDLWLSECHDTGRSFI